MHICISLTFQLICVIYIQDETGHKCSHVSDSSNLGAQLYQYFHLIVFDQYKVD